MKMCALIRLSLCLLLSAALHALFLVPVGSGPKAKAQAAPGDPTPAAAPQSND